MMSPANLTGVGRLDLSDNRLTGVIADALTTMPNLNNFDVSNNTPNGELPKFNPSVKSNVGMIIGILIAVVLLITFCWLFIRHRRKKNAEKFGPVSTNGSPDGSGMTKIHMVQTNGNSNRNTAVPTHYSQVSISYILLERT